MYISFVLHLLSNMQYLQQSFKIAFSVWLLNLKGFLKKEITMIELSCETTFLWTLVVQSWWSSALFN